MDNYHPLRKRPERTPREEAENTVAQYKVMKVRPNFHDAVAFSSRQTSVLTHIYLTVVSWMSKMTARMNKMTVVGRKEKRRWMYGDGVVRVVEM